MAGALASLRVSLASERGGVMLQGLHTRCP